MPQGFLPSGLTAISYAPGLSTWWSYTCFVAPRLYTRWSFISLLLFMYMLVLSCHINIVSMLSHIQITSSHALFTNFYQHMHIHKTLLNPHVLKHNLTTHYLIKTSIQHTQNNSHANIIWKYNWLEVIKSYNFFS
jgi:hypothetical protein